MSSLDSHTIVPTPTMLGRFGECTREVMAVPWVPLRRWSKVKYDGS